MYTSFGRLLASSIVVLLIMLFAAHAAIKQAENSMANLLGEKGASLVSVCESILSSGMRHEIGVRLQVLFEEMISNADIIFAAVTMPDGTILAHSDPNRLGETLELNWEPINIRKMQELEPSFETKWQMLNLEGRDVFAVYKLFTQGFGSRNIRLPIPIIFLGMDISPFETSRRQNRIYISLLMGLGLLMMFMGFAAFFFAQRAKESEKKQRVAEGLVKELEEQVKRSEKLAAIGSLAAGVAHEIRNPLSSIKGYATYFGERFPADSEDRVCANVMVEEVDRLNRVITDLIGLSKPSQIKQEIVDPATIILQVARLMRHDLETSQVRLKIYQGKNIPQILADAERLHQALINLCLNAIHAMEGGGRLILGVRRFQRGIVFLVIDSGVGIAEDFLSRIFDPYFTTRGSGTGLGLALVHKIVEAHEGSIIVRSRQSKPNSKKHSGTMFKIFLPGLGD
ncbi:MAG: two-component system sensor histidine kinase ZraS [Desulfovibrionaceae bacterium]|nr:two-component system sensor histidine kinase ZraS [Desulfovibrionaceae bacterium]